MSRIFRAFVSDEGGATMVEYGIMLALVAAVCVVIIGTLGGKVSTTFQPVIDELP